MLPETFENLIRQKVEEKKDIEYISTSCFNSFISNGGIVKNLVVVGDDSDLHQSVALLKSKGKIEKLIFVKSMTNTKVQCRRILKNDSPIEENKAQQNNKVDKQKN